MQTPVASDTTIKAIADLAERAGLSHIHMLGWRDLDDDEAGGSEVHAHNIAAIWAQSGLRVTMRTSRYPAACSASSESGVCPSIGRSPVSFNTSPFGSSAVIHGGSTATA